MTLLNTLLIVIGVLTLYMRFRLNSKIAIDKLLTLATSIILFHGIHYHIVYTYFACSPYLEALAPYRLLYSPMIYFSIQLAQVPAMDKSERYLKIHLFPIIFFTLFFITLSLFDSLRNIYGEFVFELLLLAEALSYLTYAIASVILIYKKMGKSQWYPYMKGLAEVAVMLIILAGTYSLIQFFKEIDRNSSVLTRSYDFNLLLLVITIIMMFMLTIEQLISRTMFATARSIISKKSKSTPLRKKLIFASEITSSTSEKQTIHTDGIDKELADFIEKLNRLVATDWFLNSEINLKSLADETKTTPHFVSKAFNEGLQTNFNQYVNQLRIEYIVRTIKIQLQKGATLDSIEELSLQAGFKSKSTFNRHFKIIMGQTPTEFIDSL